MLFNLLLNEYEDHLIVRNLKRKTISSTVRVLTMFWKYIHGKGGESITAAKVCDIVGYIDYLKGASRHSHGYIYLQVSVIRNFFRYLYSHKYVESNDVSEYIYIRSQKSLPRNLPSEDDLNSLLSGDIPLTDRTIVELYYGTGIRLSELINLNINDADLKSNLLFIRDGKGDKDRIVPLTDYCVGLIKDYLLTRGDRTSSSSKGQDVRELGQSKGADPLFLSSTKKRITQTVIARIFKRLNESAVYAVKNKTHLSSHVLRHSFATHMLKNGAGIRDIQEILGHSDIGTTERYTKVEITDLKRVIKRYHPRENEIYTSEKIVLPSNTFFTRKSGCKRKRKSPLRE